MKSSMMKSLFALLLTFGILAGCADDGGDQSGQDQGQEDPMQDEMDTETGNNNEDEAN